MKEPTEPLIYTPAKRGNVALLIMLAGPSGSGKTKSALRLATGLAGGGPIGLCDTEHGRALFYADEFEFKHLPLKEPFRPSRLEDAAVIAQREKQAAWICDSFSHEHVGPGGVLDMQEAELQRMAGNDFARRDAMKYTAWIAPKQEHKHLLQRLWQLNMHIILCCHAEKKLDLIKNDKGKFVPNPDAGLSPVCAPDIPYAMTCSFLLDPKRPGVPTWLKRFDKIEHMIDTNRPLDEETGRRLAAWARGEKPEEKQSRSKPPPPAAVDERPENSGSVENPDSQQPEPPPPSDGMFPGDLPLNEPSQPAASRSKNEVVLAEMIYRFERTASRADHHAIVDQKADRDRIAWFKKNKPEMHARLRAAMEASWARTDPAKKGQAA